MKSPKPIFLLCLLLLQVTLSAQIQWYQKQNGNKAQPYGAVATAVQPFNTNAFIACYLWHTDNELNTWKISKSNVNGIELKTFFITAISAKIECKVGKNNTVYVFERSFTADYSPQYIAYKLDPNLDVVAQRNIELPSGFFIYNIGAFELDNFNNIYFAGDGQYPDAAGGKSPASFVMKTSKNLKDIWRRIDSSETSYTRLHIDRRGRVLVIEDNYIFFPQVRIKRFTGNGQSLAKFTVQTDPNRYSVSTILDNEDNILMYGGKTINGIAQAMYLNRVSGISGNVLYSKTHFASSLSQLNDFKTDRNGNIFTLITQNFGLSDQQCKISRINLSNGNITWSRNWNYSEDSCNLVKLVINDNDRFYAIGQRKSGNYFSKGFAVRLKKNGGQLEGNFLTPDSVVFQRSHWLTDGVMDNNNRLIAIGSTYDFDTLTYSSTNFRSFAMRLGTPGYYGRGGEDLLPDATEETEKVELTTKLVIYPNPVQNQLTVSNINPEEYDKIAVYSMQGGIQQQQNVNSTMARLDISSLPDGVYLLVLRSSAATVKEKSIKFIVRK